RGAKERRKGLILLPSVARSHRALHLRCGATRCARSATAPRELSARSKTSGGNRAGGQAIVAPRIAGGMTASLPTYRRIRKRRARPLKAADKTASCRNERRLW